jgi:polynucleotide 5'-kinase involved in rRNA processing
MTADTPGHLVCYRPPWIFGAVFEAAKAFIDPKTASKIVFVNGDDKDGSENDKKMQEIIGEERSKEERREERRERREEKRKRVERCLSLVCTVDTFALGLY